MKKLTTPEEVHEILKPLYEIYEDEDLMDYIIDNPDNFMLVLDNDSTSIAINPDILPEDIGELEDLREAFEEKYSTHMGWDFREYIHYSSPALFQMFQRLGIQADCV
mgnify:CR=1 FL=1